jgi:hypothetical protein
MAKQQEGGGNRFLGFEPVTMVPFESDLILADMMTSKQVSPLKNAHHHLYITHHLFLMCTFLFFFLAQPSQTKQSAAELPFLSRNILLGFPFCFPVSR